MTTTITRHTTRGITRPIVGYGGGTVLPTIQPLSAYWEAETTAYEAVIGAMTDAEKYAVNQVVRSLKLWGVWNSLLNTNSRILLTCQSTKAKGLVNLLNPSQTVTEVGTTTFAAFDGISTSGPSNYLDTTIQIVNLNRNAICFGGICVSANAGVAAAYDMGVVDASSTTRCLLLSRSATDVMAGAAMCPTQATLGASTDYAVTGQFGPVWLNRFQGADFGVGRWTQRRITSTTASVAPVGSTPFKFLFGTGATASAQKWGAFWLINAALTDAQAGYLAAALQVCVDGFRNGLPTIQPAGYGDAAVSVDVLIEDNNITAAYECKRQFPSLNVALLCDYTVESVEQIGLQNCINWADVTTGLPTPASSGLWYESRRQENLRQGTTAGNTQAGTSTASQSKNLLARRMLDSTRSSGALPGVVIPVYFSNSIRSMVKVGLSGNTLTTNDGRVFTFKYIGEGGYDGDVIYQMGLPYVQGREAGGSGKENLNGWRPTQRSKPRDTAGNSYDISPWVGGGTGPTGTKLPYMIDFPSTYVTGQAYPAMQSMNIRQQGVDATSNKGRKAPWTGGPIYAQPAGYDALNYEAPARVDDAITIAGRSQTKTDFMSFSDGTSNLGQGPYGNVLDLNNGPSVATDLGNNGNLYAAAGQDITARKAVAQNLINYFLGYMYWIISSGDPRISAAIVTSMSTNFGLDASNALDYHSMFPLHVSKEIYRRNTVYRLQNAGGIVEDAIDGTATDGAAPRISSNVITQVQYTFDNHAEFWAPFDAGDGSGTVFWRFGSFSDSSQGNINGRTPIPAEVCMAAESDAPQMMTWTAYSMTYVMVAAARMEAQQGLCAQICGITLGQACTDGVSVQNTITNKMGTIRTLAAGAGDSVAPVLTTTT